MTSHIAGHEPISRQLNANRENCCLITNNLTGVAKGKNVIIIQMEAMQNFLLGRSVDGQEVTPNLNRLTQSSIYFDNYFTQIGQGGQMDLEPTLLNLLGISPTNKVLFGQDLLNTKDGFSVFRVWAPDGSFATNDVFYIASRDGNFNDGTAYDRKTGQKISLDGLKKYYDQAQWELHASDLILQTDALPVLLNN